MKNGSKKVDKKLQKQFARMQTPAAKKAAKALFSATPQELGAAAVKAAKPKA